MYNDTVLRSSGYFSEYGSINVPETALSIWRQGHGLVSHPTNGKSGRSNSDPRVQDELLVHKTTPATQDTLASNDIFTIDVF